jgi:hypothetical protein
MQGNSDPRGLLDALRAQKRDAILDESLAQLRITP